MLGMPNPGGAAPHFQCKLFPPIPSTILTVSFLRFTHSPQSFFQKPDNVSAGAIAQSNNFSVFVASLYDK
jgi:hypothetical protein